MYQYYFVSYYLGLYSVSTASFLENIEEPPQCALFVTEGKKDEIDDQIDAIFPLKLNFDVVDVFLNVSNPPVVMRHPMFGSAVIPPLFRKVSVSIVESTLFDCY